MRGALGVSNLKEAKDWCDLISKYPNGEEYFELNIKTNFSDFLADLNSLTDYKFEVIDKSEERNLKLMSLGLGSLENKIDLVSKGLSLKLIRLSEIHKNDHVGGLYDVYFDFFKDFLIDLNDDKLDEFVNKKLKKLKING